jgi:drug/metabolite transporter (DMT)-like permease
MLGAAVCWALAELSLGAIGSDYGAAQVVWSRYVLHLGLIAAWAALRGRPSLLRSGRPWLHLARGLCLLAMPFLFVSSLVHLGSPGLVWALSWWAPLLAVVLAVALRSECIGGLGWVSVCVVYAGVLLMLHPRPPSVRAALLLPLLAGASFGLFLLKPASFRRESSLTAVFYTALAIVVPLSFVVPFVWVPFTTKAALAVVWMSGWWFGALYCIEEALNHGPLSLLAPVLWAEPIFGAVLTWAVARQAPRTAAAIGAGVIVAGLLALARVAVRGRGPRAPA